MNIQRLFTHFRILYIPFVILDFIWFGFITGTLHKEQLGHLMAHPECISAVSLLGTLVLLALIVIGALVFLTPQIANSSYPQSFLLGAFYGLVAYGVSSLSNFVHFSGWPLQITLLDTAWGMAICGALGLSIALLNRSKTLTSKSSAL